MIDKNNSYSLMQKHFYSNGTSNHDEHNANKDYWDVLLQPLKNSKQWEGKMALDFGCGKGRNVTNISTLANWKSVDGIDISEANINHCKNHINGSFYINNGVDLYPIEDNTYDFVMSTISLQHIPVYEIRFSLISDISRIMKQGGVFSFQMGYGNEVGALSGYYDNFYNAIGTNSLNDVQVVNENEIINDLNKIGFVNHIITIKPSYSDNIHDKWIYVTTNKP
jgi:ubiquinone/menaquinone biosynthesis C-methylase UbiE